MTQSPPIRTDLHDELIGKTLRGEYRIDAVLGAGGMARVYRARQLGVDRDVVIKVMSPPSTRAEEWRARFMEEARAASRVRHPGIVTIYSFGEEEGVGPFIAMEYVEGVDLREVLTASRPLDPVRACDLIAQVCRAIGAAHEAGVVHRDLKPDNVMIEVRGGEEIARVLDFGIAKPEDSAVTTLDEHVVGTPEYMAPEQARKSPVDPRMDVYSTGIILYELVFGKRPFWAPDALTLMFKHVQQPLPLDEFRAEWPAALRVVLATACAKDPEERYATAVEMAVALEEIARPDGRSATPHSTELGGGSSGDFDVRTPAHLPVMTNPIAEPIPATRVQEAVPSRRPAYLALAGLAATFVLIAVAFFALAEPPEAVPEDAAPDETVPVAEAPPEPAVPAQSDSPDPAHQGFAVEMAVWTRRVALERARGAALRSPTPVVVPPRPAAPKVSRPADDFSFERVAPPPKKRPAVLQPGFDD